jgi:alpha-methylacyl-CoA racemase
VLSLAEASVHPHHRARGTFIDVGGVTQAAPAPRFQRSSPGEPTPPVEPGTHTAEILRSLGFTDRQIEHLRTESVVA